VHVFGLRDGDDDIDFGQSCSVAASPTWVPGVSWQLEGTLQGAGTIIALRFEAEIGIVGIDNAGVQMIDVPSWSWCCPGPGGPPTIETGGPEGNYLHIPAGGSVWVWADFPEDATSFAYWRRVGGTIYESAFYLAAYDANENGENLIAIENDLAAPDVWVKRVLDLTAFPLEGSEVPGPYTQINFSFFMNNSEPGAYVDIALSTASDADADGDGLYDDWEEHGVYSRGGMYVFDEVSEEMEWTTQDNFIDLPAMGADPDKPDIFVHLDYMCRAEDEEEQEGDCDEEHATVLESAELSSAAIETVVEVFYNSPYDSPTSSMGINLWVDQGPESILDHRSDPPTTWGSLSMAGPIKYDAVLGSGDYDWGEFDSYKKPRLILTGRLPIFHYAIAGERFSSSTNDKSGKSRGIDASDFIITLGSFLPKFGTVDDQTGTFMHELGHNLGLYHGGDSDENYKPNYPSVMNYSYMFDGFIKNGLPGTYDYSRVDVSLDEEDLDESDGIEGAPYGYGTAYYCDTDSSRRDRLDWTAPIDWNCDNDTDDDGEINVNKNEGAILLNGFEDWDFINFWGGAIGADGDSQAGSTKSTDEIGFEEAVRKGLINIEGRPGISEFMIEKGIPLLR
jgi:hypothetical protein